MGNSLEGRDTLMASRIHQRPHLGEQLRTSIGAKAMGDLIESRIAEALRQPGSVVIGSRQ